MSAAAAGSLRRAAAAAAGAAATVARGRGLGVGRGPNQVRGAHAAAELPPPPQLPQRRVVITGIGMVTPLGVGAEAAWGRLISGGSGVRRITAADLDVPEEVFSQLPARIAARVPWGGGEGEFDPERSCAGLDARHAVPFVQYAVGAAQQALDMAGWHPETEDQRDRTGVAIGAGIGAVRDVGDAGVLARDGRLRRMSPFFIPRVLINMAAGHVSIRFGLRGPNHAAATACASGAHSIGDAFRLVRSGDADVMVAGGAESCVDAISIAGFCRLKALASTFNDEPEAASRPFDTGRAGFVIGEGAAVLVVEELGHALARGATPIAEVRGYGLSGDAHHITQPSRDGKGASLAMGRALAQSGLTAEQVGYINAHATSTPMGDEAELAGICHVYGDHAAKGGLAVSSTKGATGHLLGAAGAMEAAFTVMALSRGVLPPTLNLDDPAPDYAGMNLVPKSAQEAPGLVAACSNSFGFGGTNTSLLFSKPPASLPVG